jgi:hypothetical protein
MLRLGPGYCPASSRSRLMASDDPESVTKNSFHRVRILMKVLRQITSD